MEGVLAAHPAIADVGVIGVPDAARGEMVCAVVELEPGATLALDDVVAHCVDAGMMRQKIPERLELVDAVPRNTAGKIEKRVLRAQFAE